MRQKNRRRSLLTLYHHHGHDKRISSGNHNHHDNHLLHSDKSTYTYFYKLKSKLVNSSLGPQNSAHTSIPLLVSGFGLLMLLGVMISPSISAGEGIFSSKDKAYAEGGVEGINTEAGMDAQASNMRVQLALKDPEVDTLTTQAETGKVNYISKGFTVTTSNVDGYNVYVQTAPGSSNKLQNGNITIDFVKTEDTAPANFTDNSWGYKVDATGTTPENLTYSPVPEATATNLNPAYSSKSTGETRDFTLNFAAKFASDATPGHYGTDVILSVAAGAYEVAVEFPKWTISNMQDMNSTICANAKENTTGQLTDLRDGKQYWVTKLKDGNCWMTQNLDFDLKQGQALTPELSDVQTNWTPGEGEGTIATGELSATSWPDNNALIRSYDPGEYVYTKGTEINSCGENQNNLASCIGWETADGKIASNSPDFGSAIVDNIYNAHYTIGNYYNYGAATAGTGSSLTENNQDAASSVCPRGWQLPKSGGDNNKVPSNLDKTFAKLLETYGWTWEVAPTENWQINYYSDTVISNTGYNLRTNPMYFLASGNVNTLFLSLVGYAGIYWSASVLDEASSFRLGFDTRVNPASVSRRSHGLSIRCVAR